MHWPSNSYLLQILHKESPFIAKGVTYITAFAPLFSLLAACANLCLAITIFRFTRRKNDSDRNIKWFQELVYSPNKEIIGRFFLNLLELKNKVSMKADLSEDERISLMQLLKTYRQEIIVEFIELLKIVSPPTHSQALTVIDDIIDTLTKSFDNDEIKWNNKNVIEKHLTTPITNSKHKITSIIFNYKGT